MIIILNQILEGIANMKNIILMLLLILGGSMVSQAGITPGEHELTFISNYDASVQPYCLYVPKIAVQGEALPLAVVLHGKTVDQYAWFKYTPIKEHAENNGYITAAPYGRGDYFYQGAGEQDVLDIIERVKDICNIDTDRIYLVGHSMGGWGTWWLGLRHPDIFASICPMAGMAPIELMANAEHLSPLIIHDSTDPIVNVEHSRNAVNHLKNLNIDFEYREEKGYGHSSKMIGDNLDRIYEWFKNHPKTENPDYIRHVLRTPKCGKAYWLEVLKTNDFPQYATIEATRDNVDKVTIKTDNINQFAIDLKSVQLKSDSPLVVNVDDSVLNIPANQNYAIFTQNSIHSKWQYGLRDLPPIPYESSNVATIPADIVSSESSEFIPNEMGKLLLKVIDTDMVLLNDDMFVRELPAGNLSADDLLDVYVYPEKQLGRFTCKKDHFKNIMEMESPKGMEWWGKLQIISNEIDENNDEYTVIAPMNVAKTFEPKPEVLPETIPEYLIEAVSKNTGMK